MAQESMRTSAQEGRPKRPKLMARDHVDGHVQQSILFGHDSTCLQTDRHGTCFQFGGTPELGCRDGLFTFKALLNARWNHNLAMYVGFVDLVKAYDMANHTLLLRILECYGAPPKFVAAIQTIYTDNICVLKIEKEIVKIPQSVGVRQGDNMAPVLFLFLMTAFAETLEIVWRQQEIPIVSVMTAKGDNMINGKICSHTPTMFKSTKLTAYKILQFYMSMMVHSRLAREATCREE